MGYVKQIMKDTRCEFFSEMKKLKKWKNEANQFKKKKKIKNTI